MFDCESIISWKLFKIFSEFLFSVDGEKSLCQLEQYDRSHCGNDDQCRDEKTIAMKARTQEKLNFKERIAGVKKKRHQHAEQNFNVYTKVCRNARCLI